MHVINVPNKSTESRFVLKFLITLLLKMGEKN